MYLVPWLRELEPDRAWINPVDADPRGIKNGDEIYVFNDRGKVAIPAWVTEMKLLHVDMKGKKTASVDLPQEWITIGESGLIAKIMNMRKAMIVSDPIMQRIG